MPPGISEMFAKLTDTLDTRFQDVEQRFQQVRHDVDEMATSQRRTTKALLASRFDGEGRSRFYRGMLSSAEESRQFGLAILAFCLKNGEARNQLDNLGGFTRAMGEGTDTGGGFLVPEQMHDSIIRLVEQFGVFRRNAMVLPLASDSDIWPKRTGGLTVYCPGEGAAITASDITVTLIRLVAKKWCCLSVLSSELSADAAIAVGELVAMEIALAFAQKEDVCGFLGDGTAAYFGITGVMNHASTAVQTCEATDVTYAQACEWKYLAGAMGLVPTWALPTSRWYFHRTVFFNCVVGARDANGVPLVKFVGVGGQPSDAPLQLGAATPTLLGFPVELVDCLPATSDTPQTSKNVWAFGSLRMGWWLGQRGGMDVAESRDVYFAQDQVAIRGKQRISIVAADASALVRTATPAA